MNEEMRKAIDMLQVAELELDKFIWAKSTVPEPDGATAYIGVRDNKRVVVVIFSIEDQGFPPGSVGYDGMLHVGGMIIRMPRPMAERFFKRGAETLEGKHG